MSFILDALKKSESDRQRQTGPSLFEVKVAPPRRTLPIWAVAIAILLLVNVIVISWMLLRHPATQQTAPAGAAPATSPPVTMVPAANPGGGAVPLAAPGGRSGEGGERPGTASGTGALPAGGLAPMGAEAPAGASARAGTAASAGGGAASAGAPAVSASQPPAMTRDTHGADQNGDRASASDPQSDDAPAVEPAAGAGPGAPGGTSGDLPLYQQIVANDGLPALHLDLHVFADRPRDRFVMINMHRLGEGDSLPSGVQVEAIRPDGAVLTYHGTRFLLPRN